MATNSHHITTIPDFGSMEFALGHGWRFYSQKDEVRRELFISENQDNYIIPFKSNKNDLYAVLPTMVKPKGNVYSLGVAVSKAVKKKQSVLVIEKLPVEDGEKDRYWIFYVHKGQPNISSEKVGGFVAISSVLQTIQELVDAAENPDPEEELEEGEEFVGIKYVGSGIQSFVFDAMGNPIKSISIKEFLGKTSFKKFSTLSALKRKRNLSIVLAVLGISAVSLLGYALMPKEQKKVVKQPTAKEVLEKKYQIVKPKLKEAQGKAQNQLVFDSWAKEVYPSVTKLPLSDYSSSWSVSSINCNAQACEYSFESELRNPPREPLQNTFSSICGDFVFVDDSAAKCTKQIKIDAFNDQILYKERYTKFYERLSLFTQKISGFGYELKDAKPVFTAPNLAEFKELMNRDNLYVVHKGTWRMTGRILNLPALVTELSSTEGFVPENIFINIKDKKFDLNGVYYAKD